MTIIELSLTSLLKRRAIDGPPDCAEATARLLQRLVQTAPSTASDHLLAEIRSVGQQLTTAVPAQLVVGNVVQRVLGLVSEEARSLNQDALREEITEGIDELLDELRQADDQIAAYALDHIAPHETVMTYGFSLTVLKFLLKAAVKRKFTVLALEAPSQHASRTSVCQPGLPIPLPTKTLTSLGSIVMVNPDSAAFALLARTNKLILHAEAVYSDGSFVAAPGTKMLARAAQEHRVPVVVLAGVWKISPLYPFAEHVLQNPQFAGRALHPLQHALEPSVAICDVGADVVPASLVDLFITNIGGFSTPSIRRVAADHYLA